MKPKSFLTSTIVLITIIFFSSCKEDSPVLCDPTPQFSVDEFVNQIASRLASQPIVGYQFAVNKDGNLYHEQNTGLARHANDPGGPVAINSSHRFNVASVAKFIGTIALVKVLEDNNISLDFSFVDYLPPSWHDQVHVENDHTFRELLTNQTAINYPGATPPAGEMPTEAQMLQALSAPPDPGRFGVYQNGNFTLIRVLIGQLVYQLDETSAVYATECTDKYFEYIAENILSKLSLACPKSVDEVNNYYNTSTYPWAYQFPFNATFSNPADGSLGWGHSNSPYRNGGSAGLMLSALDIAKIMAYFKHDNSALIISEVRRNLILDSELGLTESVTGTHGRYQSKGGLRGPDNCCGRAIRARIMLFPNNVEAVIITNSNHTGLGLLLRQAFDASWIDPC